MSTKESTRHLNLDPFDKDRLNNLCGPLDENLHQIEKHLGVKISNRGNKFDIIGIPNYVDKACEALKQLYAETRQPEHLTKRGINLLLKSLEDDINPDSTDLEAKLNDAAFATKNLTIKPRTRNQRHYLRAIQQFDINFGVGPAGTGKTFLAVACAVLALEKEQVARIVLTRPAVEAGENLGFLPGDLTEKIDPYLRPLYDSLYLLMGAEKINKLISKGVIEIAPLAFMRGRTLNDSFIILDEGQNTTKEQMHMFLTRIGFGSKAIITGDITQTDLPKPNQSGLRHAINVLRDVDAIRFTFLTSQDAVRHPLVQKIIQAYENSDNQ